MLIDAGCLKHREPLQKLREISPTICLVDGYVELLGGDEQALRQLKTYAAISGYAYEVKDLDAHYSIRITSTCL